MIKYYKFETMFLRKNMKWKKLSYWPGVRVALLEDNNKYRYNLQLELIRIYTLIYKYLIYALCPYIQFIYNLIHAELNNLVIMYRNRNHKIYLGRAQTANKYRQG